MRDVIKTIESSSLPVLVYIGGPGARAASAGAFITLASDLAIMAKATNIGAAHPVGIRRTDEGNVKEKKAAEDARAYIKAIADKHGRNSDWAEQAVTESSSLTAQEALEAGVVEYVVADHSELENILEGKKLTKHGKEMVLEFKGKTRELSMTLPEKMMSHLGHPNLAYILFILGLYGIIFELSNPGIGLGAVVGGISLILASMAFQVLPISVAGLLLIILGILLMVIDIWVPSFGVLTIGGLVSFIIGSLTLYDTGSIDVGFSLNMVIGASAGLLLFFVFAGGSGLRIQFSRVTTGEKGMIGLTGEALGPDSVYVRGERWAVESPDAPLLSGDRVEVVDVDGNKLKVKKV
jgi:membrane-bound serine protease (ClpP class)